MTPEERAERVATAVVQECCYTYRDEAVILLAEDIREAIEAEREECAQLADRGANCSCPDCQLIGGRIAANIRARGGQPPKDV